MKKTRLGIIGCGWVSQFYEAAVRELSERCEWAWAADPNLAAAEKFSATNGGRPLQDFHRFEMTYSPRGSLLEGDKVPWDTKLVLRRDGASDEILLEESGAFDFTGQLEHFLDCIQHKRQPLTAAESAREVIAAIRAAEKEIG